MSPSRVAEKLDPGEHLGALLKEVGEITAREKLTKEDHVRIQALRSELALTTWADADAIHAAIRLASESRENPIFLEFIEFALLAKPDPGGIRIETRQGRRVKRYAKEVYFLDSKTAQGLARRVVEEKDRNLQRLALIALRTHSGALDWEDGVYLDSSTLSELLGLWNNLDSGKGRSGQSTRQYLLMAIGPYRTRNEKVQQFLEAIVLDPKLDSETRSTALSECCRGDVSLERLALAESLFAKEGDPGIRLNAIGLVCSSFPASVDNPLKTKSFAFLERISHADPEGSVRSSAAQALMEFDDPRAVDAVAKVLDKEKEAGVRARILKGFRWATFFYEERGHRHAAQDLAARVFQNDPDEEVQRSAIGAYLDLVWRTLWVQDETGTSLDPRAIESIEKMVAAIQKKALGRDTKVFIRKKLEEDFEKRIPELAEIGDYKELKRFLEK